MRSWLRPIGARFLGVNLRTKIIGLVVGLLLLLAVAAMLQAERSITPFLNQQLDTEAVSTAKYIADRGPDYIYRGDLFQLYTLVRDIKNSNQDIRYIFLVDPQQNVLVDTFGNALPAGLLAANSVNPSESSHVEVLSTEEGLIRDLAVPISGGKIGTVRIGMSEKGLFKAKTNMLSGLAIMTFAVLFVGIILAFILSRILAAPYQRLIAATRVVSTGNLAYRLPAWPIKDEGSELTQAFNDMINIMEHSAQEIEELCILRRGLTEKVMQVQEEERRHLARELHDETSQSLASLRLGLKYAEEAHDLGEIKTRLAETRQMLAEASTGEEAIGLTQQLAPDLVLMDLSLPGIDGVEAIRKIKERRANQKILALTMHEETLYLEKVLAAGGNGFVLKRAADVELLSAIQAVHRGEIYIDSALQRYLVIKALQQEEHKQNNQELAELTPREKEVLKLVALGYSNQEIAKNLVISVKTVENHKTKIKEKLEITSRSKLVRYAMENGLI